MMAQHRNSQIEGEQFYKHPHFDLLLPTNQVLETLVGDRILERRVCHEWPLSCVEVVDFEGGDRKYCKTMGPPSKEAEVYESLTSPILVPHVLVAKSQSSTTLLLDSFDGERLSPEAVTSIGLDNFIEDFEQKLSTLSGPKVVYLDLSTVENVRGQMSAMIERLDRLYGAGAPYKFESTLLDVGSKLATTRAVEEAFIEDARYSNGDLSADNVLNKGDDLRVIDWQFPRITSLRVEAANLCPTLGIDPRLYLSDQEIAAGLLCKVRWLAECAEVWFPVHGYREEVRGLMLQLAQLNVKA